MEIILPPHIANIYANRLYLFASYLIAYVLLMQTEMWMRNAGVLAMLILVAGHVLFISS